MKTYCIGTAGQPPRLFLTADVEQVALNVRVGEVFFSQDAFPPSPNKIAEDGLSLVALDISLDDVRAARWGEAKVVRDQKMAGGCMTPKGRVDTDPDSQRKIVGSVTAALVSKSVGQPFSINWTMADNAVEAHSADEMVGMGMAVMQHIAMCQGAGDFIRNELTAATSVEEIAAIDIEANYPV